MSEIAILYCTAPNRDVALAIARALIEQRLVACANLFDGATSIYRWQGAVHEDHEAALILKTRRELIDQATQRIRELHPYSCPAIVAWEPIGGHADYFRWIADETSGSLV